MAEFRHVRSLLGAAATASLALGALPACATARPALAVTNFISGETIRYTAPLLMGTLADANATTVTLVNESSQRPTRTLTGLAHKGRFKVLADLVPGENKMVVRAGGAALPFTLVFKPQANPYTFRAVYYTDNTGDAGYLSPVPDDKQDVAGKLGTAMLLMQSFTAEEMRRHGYGRRTFNVELDEQGRVKVHIVKGDQAPNAGLNGNAMNQAIEKQAGAPLTHYLVILGRGCGYTAVGGGGKALFGGTCIYSWPDTLQSAQAAFMDPTPIDKDKFHVDAVGRDVFWANTSTCIGACLHEIVHTFGVPHSMDPHCMMTRGMDRFNRFFTFVEPPSKHNPKPYEFRDDEIARYATVTANNLWPCRFLALDGRTYHEQSKPQIAYNAAVKEIVATSDLGIAFLGLEVPYANPGADYVLPIDPAKPLPRELRVPAADWERFKGRKFQVRAIDIDDHCVIDRDPLRATESTGK